MKRKIISFILFILLFVDIFSENTNKTVIESNKELFHAAFNEQLRMLQGYDKISLKRSIFLYENAYYNGTLNYKEFCQSIDSIVRKLKYNIKINGFEKYKTAGNWIVFSYMKEPSAINKFQPFTYDFEDFAGEKDYSKMFVTKLMKTKKGNCMSLPLFYKILCEELNTEAFLAKAPNHLYIKHRDEEGKWTNVELTNGGFPRDQWIIQQLSISVEAIRQDVYMRPLSEKENIVLTMHVLANAYKFKYGYDKFVLSIADSALSYSPNNIQILMLKANCLLSFGKEEQKNENKNVDFLSSNYKLYQECVAKINKLGYSEIDKEKYSEWIKSVESNKKE